MSKYGHKIDSLYFSTACSTKRYGRSPKVYRKHAQSRDREDGARANRFITGVCPTNARHTSPQDMDSLHWAGALHGYAQPQSLPNCSPLRPRLEFRSKMSTKIFSKDKTWRHLSVCLSVWPGLGPPSVMFEQLNVKPSPCSYSFISKFSFNTSTRIYKLYNVCQRLVL